MQFFKRQKNQRRQHLSSFIDPSAPLVKAINLSHQYGERPALKSLNFTLYKGSLTFLTGPSGAGKSTFLKIIGQEFGPSYGELSFNASGERVFSALCYQDLKIIPEISVFENLVPSFQSRAHRSWKLFQRQAGEYWNFLAPGYDWSSKCADLNGGAKQKLSLLRAILARPQLLLADEPTASLDTENVHRIFQILEHERKENGTTVVWATHGRDIVRRYSANHIHLERGVITHHSKGGS